MNKRTLIALLIGIILGIILGLTKWDKPQTAPLCALEYPYEINYTAFIYEDGSQEPVYQIWHNNELFLQLPEWTIGEYLG